MRATDLPMINVITHIALREIDQVPIFLRWGIKQMGSKDASIFDNPCDFID